MTSTNVNQVQRIGTDSDHKDSGYGQLPGIDWRSEVEELRAEVADLTRLIRDHLDSCHQPADAREYSDLFDRLRAQIPETHRALLFELDSAVGLYVNRAHEAGIRAGLAGLGWAPAGDECMIEAAGDTMTVSEVAEAAGIDAQLWMEVGGVRVPVSGATVQGHSIVLWSESPAVDLVDRVASVERRLDALGQNVTTRCLEVVDEWGRVHVAAHAGEDWGSVHVFARTGSETDNGPGISVLASEEDSEDPMVYVVARVGEEVHGAVGTSNHPYGEEIRP